MEAYFDSLHSITRPESLWRIPVFEKPSPGGESGDNKTKKEIKRNEQQEEEQEEEQEEQRVTDGTMEYFDNWDDASDLNLILTECTLTGVQLVFAGTDTETMQLCWLKPFYDQNGCSQMFRPLHPISLNKPPIHTFPRSHAVNVNFSPQEYLHGIGVRRRENGELADLVFITSDDRFLVCSASSTTGHRSLSRQEWIGGPDWELFQIFEPPHENKAIIGFYGMFDQTRGLARLGVLAALITDINFGLIKPYYFLYSIIKDMPAERVDEIAKRVGLEFNPEASGEDRWKQVTLSGDHASDPTLRNVEKTQSLFVFCVENRNNPEGFKVVSPHFIGRKNAGRYPSFVPLPVVTALDDLL